MRVFRVVKEIANAFVMPGMRAGRYKKSLAWLKVQKISQRFHSQKTLHRRTAIEFKQMVHSVLCFDAVSLSFLRRLAASCWSCLCVDLLQCCQLSQQGVAGG